MRHVWQSKTHALRGIRYAFRHEPNFRVQLVVSVGVLVLAAILQISFLESIVLICFILAVLVLELFNTTIEALSDIVKPRLHEQVKQVKDIAAGMVLLVSLAAACVGIAIFYPYVLAVFMDL